jgi:hypothetical protein
MRDSSSNGQSPFNYSLSAFHSGTLWLIFKAAEHKGLGVLPAGIAGDAFKLLKAQMLLRNS